MDWCWSWSSNILATWCEELTHWKRPWCWEWLKAGGEGDNRGWDSWMASLTQWTEFEEAPGVGDGQGSLTGSSPWGVIESDRTERLKWTALTYFTYGNVSFHVILCIYLTLSKSLNSTKCPCSWSLLPTPANHSGQSLLALSEHLWVNEACLTSWLLTQGPISWAMVDIRRWCPTPRFSLLLHPTALGGYYPRERSGDGHSRRSSPCLWFSSCWTSVSYPCGNQDSG